jgi:hypothetical protein
MLSAAAAFLEITMKPSERLLQRLRDELDLDIPEGARLERAPGASAGWNRTALGAWVWTVCGADGVPLTQDSKGRPMAIGSQWTMTELVRLPLVAHPDLFGDIVIGPTDEVQQAMRRG